MTLVSDPPAGTGSPPSAQGAPPSTAAAPAAASLPAALAVAWAATALAACGGGGGGDAPGQSGPTAPPTPAPPAPAPAPTPPPAPAPITRADASRFLAQASFAATDADIARVQALGYAGWIDEQFALPRSQGHYDWMVERGYAVEANLSSFAGADNTLWRKLVSSPDALRQRITLALSEIFVISMTGLPINWRGFAVAAYVDLLEQHAFGNYRSLLEAVTLSVGMGSYLNLRGNQKADPARGRVPDENYAREVLQLFSIGLHELNPDGTLRGGVATETYGPDTISGLARVFTGWDFDNASRSEPSYTARPLVLIASRHETGEKRFLGTVIPANTDGTTSMRRALDAIAAHANVAPFIGRQLIQRLVASHPSAAYVGRVAAVFNNNGSGQRGDLKAVIKAVLLDPEARGAPAAGETTRGKLREPVQRFVQWARTFKLASPTGLWNIGNLSDPATRLGQSPLRAPSVFNFFRPGYVPPNSALGSAGITAPEFQLVNESTVVGWANFAQGFVNGSAIGETRPDVADELALAGDPAALVARVVLLLAADALPAATVALITNAVASIGATTDSGRRNRVNAAVHLVLCAPDYLVQV